MVKLNPVTGAAMSDQNAELLKSLGNYKDKYPEETVKQALTILQDPNFMSEGLLRLLIMSIQNGTDLSALIKQTGDAGSINPATAGAIKNLETQLITSKDKTDRNLSELENSVKVATAEFEKSTTRIYSKLQENEFNGPMATILSSMQLAIADIRKRYADDLAYLQVALVDSVLNYEEKIRISYIINSLKVEYPSLKTEIEKYEADTEQMVKSYDRLFSSIDVLYLEKNINTVVDGNLLLTNFTSYYDDLLSALEEMLANATVKFNALVSEAVEKANRITDIAGYIAEATARKLDIQFFFNRVLEDALFDRKEKTDLNRFYYKPLLEKLLTQDLDLAEYYEKDSNRLQTLATSLEDKVTKSRLLTTMDRDTPYPSDIGILSDFLAYYDAELDLYNAIKPLADSALTSAKTEVVSHSTSITQTNREIDLSAKEVKLTGEMLQTTQAGINIMADAITSTVKRVTTTRDITTSNDIINGIGFNLYVALKSNAGFIEPTTKALLPTINGSRVSEKISITGGVPYTASLWNNSINNTIWIYWMNSSGQVLQTDTKSSTDSEFHLTATAPNSAVFAQLVTYQTASSHLQFQLGEVATAYRLSAYDSINNVLLAQAEVEDKQRDLDTNTFNFNEYSLMNYQADLELTKVMSDYRITLEEKKKLSDILDKLNLQYRYISNKFYSYQEGGSLNKLDGLILTLTEFTSLVEDTMGDFVVTSPDNVKADYTDFFNEVKLLMETLNGLLIKDIEKSKERASASTKSALDAETLRNDVRRELENTAHTISTLKKFKDDEDLYEETVMEALIPFLEDGVLSAIEKVTVNDMIGRIKVEDEWYQETADKLSVGKAGFLNGKTHLLDLVNPMLTVNELYSPSKIDKEKLQSAFQKYYDEKGDLLEKIIASYIAQYGVLQVQYSAAYSQYELKNEELLTYQEAVNSAKEQMNNLSDAINELQNATRYTIRLTSSMGEIFTNQNINTRLSVQFLKNDIDYTDSLRPSDIIWSKIDAQGNPDEAWNEAHINAGPYIDITEADVKTKAVFKVTVYELIA